MPASEILPRHVFQHHGETTRLIAAEPRLLFAHLDDPRRIAGHMSTSSRMMAGSAMQIDVDELGGRQIGSHIRLAGRVLGIRLFLDEAVVSRDPPFSKAWETVGEPRLLVIGGYRLGFTIAPRAQNSEVRVWIDYDLPAQGVTHWLGRLLGGLYARWCVQQMANNAQKAFATREPELGVTQAREADMFKIRVWAPALGLFHLISLHRGGFDSTAQLLQSSGNARTGLITQRDAG